MPTEPINPNNNFGVMQKKGDHLTVAITFSIIVLIHSIGFIFPAYHASYSNILFDAVNVVGLAIYAYFGYRLWISTFEDYEAWKTVGVILSTLGIIIWCLAWGASVYGRKLNGF